MYPDWVEKYHQEGCIIKKRGNKYYLYKKRIFYDAVDKTPIEVVGECLGRIDEGGFIPSKKKKTLNTISCHYEYGATNFIDILCQDILYYLKIYFHDDAYLLYVIAKQLLISKASYDDLPFLYRNSYDFITYPCLDFSQSALINLLNRISYNKHSQYQFMQVYMNHRDYIVFLDKHYCIDMLYYFHHHSLAYFQAYPISNDMLHQNIVFIGDNDLVIPYIIPTHTDIKINHDSYFTYQDKLIYYDMILKDNEKLYIYDDPSNIFIKDNKQLLLALHTNTSINPLQLYTMYLDKKAANDMIEISHDILDKNRLYLSHHRYEEMLFINYLLIMMYQRIDGKLKGTDISVYDAIENLKLISKQMVNNQWTIYNGTEEFLDRIKDIIPECFFI